MKYQTRTRQTANGKWLGEVRVKTGLFFWDKWKAVDGETNNCGWVPGDRYFGDCLHATEQEAARSIKEHLTARYGL